MRLASFFLLLAVPAAAQTLAPRPVQAVLTGRFQEHDLTESSGVARISSVPRVIFTLNDSGNPPEIFATDSSGRAIGRWLVPGASNRDWESLSIGPCPAGSCFYIGDTGDNAERRGQVVIYRVTIPALATFRGAADHTPTRLDSAVVRYPDAPHDAEAAWVADAGDYFIVTKGRSGGVRLFRVPASAFGRNEVVTAVLVQQLPIDPLPAFGRLVTDAARSPDGRQVVIRTYTELYFFPLLGDARLGPVTRSCNLAGLEPQGEAVTWLDDRRLLLTSEASIGAGVIHIVSCDG
ncbi:MAG TPA: hypothetical protein VLD58_00770 [Gemmatimonadales bacterium]|nr:hypothetical protein [Gemmatimonadales bacterium]